ncbi:MAG: RecQ family ATP-dependent DNA helicase [Isosphaeraceae bacterium]
MSVIDRAAELEQTLRDRFGLDVFRPGQREVIENVLRGRDVLCVMPTGGGKSLCYQLPALMLPGLTLVVSPLIALMKDQVDALVQKGIRATLINSTLDPGEQWTRILEVEAGRYDLVYVAPERFRSGRFVEMIARVRPALLAIDEAHCISQWGHDFRPDYARLGLARRKLGFPPCIALTATATDLVRRDVAEQLDLRDPALFVAGFDRPNLSYAVLDTRREPDKLAALARILHECPGSSIVYASSRNRCEAVAQHVQRELRKHAVVYHAGMSREDRDSAQERFMSGEAEVVVATNAFGMGVDKPDIRSVIHYNLPGTLEAYYQDAGRAGRDGSPARCALLYTPADRVLQERFIENEYPPPEVVYRIYETLRRLDADPIELTQAEIKEVSRIELGESAVGTALKLLEAAGAIERFLPRENMAIVRINLPAEEDGPEAGSLSENLGPHAHVQRLVLLGLEGLVNRRFSEPVYFNPDDFASALGLERAALIRAIKALTADLPSDYVPPFRGYAVRVLDRKRRPRDLDIDFSALQARKTREYEKLERMIQYAQTNRCRRAYLLGYFGDEEALRRNCGRCDVCGIEGATVPSASSVAIDTPAGREVLLKVLSGVARAKGRFGKTVVAQMLKGSGAEKMERWGLKSLSTYGILSEFTQPELTRLLDALAQAGFVECPEVDRFRPIVTLTERGRAFLKDPDGGPIRLEIPDDLARKVRQGGLASLVAPRNPAREATPSEEDSDGASDDPLSERLRSLRLAWAREASQPAYTVFTNDTLDALVQARPRTPGELARVKGVGRVTLERYGAAILEAIARAPAPEQERPAEPAEPVSPPSGPSKPPLASTLRSPHVPTEEWTWRLLDRGFTPEEAAAIRGLNPAAILRHAALIARQGKPLKREWFFDDELASRWESWRTEHGDASPPPGDEGQADLWSLFLILGAARRP